MLRQMAGAAFFFFFLQRETFLKHWSCGRTACVFGGGDTRKEQLLLPEVQRLAEETEARRWRLRARGGVRGVQTQPRALYDDVCTLTIKYSVHTAPSLWFSCTSCRNLLLDLVLLQDSL